MLGSSVFSSTHIAALQAESAHLGTGQVRRKTRTARRPVRRDREVVLDCVSDQQPACSACSTSQQRDRGGGTGFDAQLHFAAAESN